MGRELKRNLMAEKVMSLRAGYIMMDAGTMFGTTPYTKWSTLYPPSADNKNRWGLNCMYVEDGNKKIIIDTGIGKNFKIKSFVPDNKQDNQSIDDALICNNIDPDQITDVVLTHLHFDHCSGCLQYDDQYKIIPTFANARYWVHKKHFCWALEPSVKEKASFLLNSFIPLHEMGVLHFFEDDATFMFSESIEIGLSHGHTPYLLVPKIYYQDMVIFHVSDIIVSNFHISLRRYTSFDNNAVKLADEKSEILSFVADNPNMLIHFGHDPHLRFARVKRKGEDYTLLAEQALLA